MQRKNVLVGVGVLVLFLIITLVAAISSNDAATVPDTSPKTVGVVDLTQITRVHQLYPKLADLEARAKTLELDLENLRLEVDYTPPEPDAEAFDEAAKQKQNLEKITLFSKLFEEVKAKEKALREEYAPRFEKEKEEVENTYLNEILNIRIKLDNAEAMRLTEKEANQYLADLDRLQMERGQAVHALKEEQERYIQGIIETTLQTEIATLAQYTQELQEAAKAEELQRLAEAQRRNAELLEETAIKPLTNTIRLAELRSELLSTQKEIAILNNIILMDIRSLVQKNALLYGLEIVLDKAENKVLWADSVDLTDTVLEEVKAKAAAAEQK